MDNSEKSAETTVQKSEAPTCDQVDTEVPEGGEVKKRSRRHVIDVPVTCPPGYVCDRNGQCREAWN